MDEQPTRTPLEKLNEAIAEYANAIGYGPVLVDVAVVMWEQVTYDDDGNIGRRISYAVPTDNFSMSSGLGLVEAAGEFIRRDILGMRGDEDD